MQRLAARLGLFAVLFQALLFGWHHHDLRFSGRLPVAVIENAVSPTQTADDVDSCEICQILHHLTAAPVDIAAALPPLAVPANVILGDAALVAPTPTLAFRARAPPSSDAAIG
jgi:hypothetical protein